MREKLGIKKGDNLILEIRGNEILLLPYDTKATENLKKDNLKDFLSNRTKDLSNTARNTEL